MSKSGGDGEEVRDSLVKDYGTVLRESALLTTFSGLLFGFLLNISILSAKQFTFSYRIIILIALFNIVVAMCMFVIPVIYHHIEFPYRDVTKFISRWSLSLAIQFFRISVFCTKCTTLIIVGHLSGVLWLAVLSIFNKFINEMCAIYKYVITWRCKLQL